jgi:WD40 repeat protein
MTPTTPPSTIRSEQTLSGDSSGTEPRVNEVFLSYSRRDKAFLQQLDAAFRAINYDPWIDWDDIKPTEDWWAAIQAGIEGCSVFVFVLSPDSVASKVCREEVEHAVLHNKRLVPVVRRDGFDTAQVHPVINRHNWIFCRETDDFDQAFKTLVDAINLDLEYVRMHTRLLTRAIEWDKKERNDSFLLRGVDLEEGELWLVKATGKEPRPTELQGGYINTSRKVETVRQKQESRRQRIALALMGVGLLAAIGATIVAVQQWQTSVNQRLNAEINTKTWAIDSLLNSGLQINAMMEGVRMGRQVQDLGDKVQDTTYTRAVVSLWQAVHQVNLRNSLKGNCQFYSASLSPDGKTIAAAASDNTIHRWTINGDSLSPLEGHEELVLSVSYSPDGKLLASASFDDTVRLWDKDGRSLNTLRGHSDNVLGVAFSPDGQTIASVSKDKTIRLWRQDGTPLAVIKGHQATVQGVAFSPDGQTIASASDDKTVKLWTLDGTLLKTFKGHDAPVHAVSFSPKGGLLASASEDGTVRLWNLKGNDSQILNGHYSDVWGVSFSPDGTQLASSGKDNNVRIWSINGEEIRTLKGHGNTVFSAAFSRDGRNLVSASADQTVKLWNLDRTNLYVMRQHDDDVNAVDFHPNKRQFASASSDGTIRLWELSDRHLASPNQPYAKPLHRLTDHKDAVNTLRFSPDGTMLASGSSDDTVKLWRQEGETEFRLIASLTGHGDDLWSVDFSSDGKLVASGGEDGTVRVWTTRGQLLHTLKGHTASVESVAFSPDSKQLASASKDTTVKLWSVEGQELFTLKGHSGEVLAVRFSPNGRTLATASGDTTIRLWRKQGNTFQPGKVLRGHGGLVLNLSFSSDSKSLISVGNDRTLRWWTLDGQAVKVMREHRDSVRSASFSPDTHFIATSGDDNTIILWDMDLDHLVRRACGWLENYLRTNPDLTLEERRLCNGINPP